MPPSVPTILLPFLSSSSLSATTMVVESTVVVVPSTIRLPPMVTVDPSSSMMPLTICLLALSHLRRTESVKFATFLISN